MEEVFTDGSRGIYTILTTFAQVKADGIWMYFPYIDVIWKTFDWDWNSSSTRKYYVEFAINHTELVVLPDDYGGFEPFYETKGKFMYDGVQEEFPE